MAAFGGKLNTPDDILGVRVRDVASGEYLWEHQHTDGTNYVIAEDGHEYEVDVSFRYVNVCEQQGSDISARPVTRARSLLPLPLDLEHCFAFLLSTDSSDVT
jgi:hypothetical protein